METIRLSSDGSAEAQALKQNLEARGYSVEVVLSGSPKPVAQYGHMYLSGYQEIRSTLVYQDPTPR
jgi:hypothetical protein